MTTLPSEAVSRPKREYPGIAVSLSLFALAVVILMAVFGPIILARATILIP